MTDTLRFVRADTTPHSAAFKARRDDPRISACLVTLDADPQPDRVQVVLVGKVDGFCDGKVVEVKNRQKRFFTQIPAYEKVQLLAYMFLTGTLEAEHVECFDQQLKSRRVEFDQEEFQQITQCALDQAKVFAELVHDVLKQDALLTWMVDNHKTIS